MLKSKKPRGRGFTLAEVMIVLTVIGILSAILLPVAINSTPDKNILKFKKANNTLATAIRDLISSGQYYKVGDLGRYPDGSNVSHLRGDLASGNTVSTGYTQEETEQYFFNTFANVVSTKEIALDWSSSGGGAGLMCSNGRSNTQFKIELDELCIHEQNNAYYKKNILKTTDNVTFYQFSNSTPFGYSQYTYANTDDGNPYWSGVSVAYPDPFNPDELNETDCAVGVNYGENIGELKFDTSYKIFCVDIDGADGAIKPFGYGIRRDGKIATGLRADWWLEREITKKETDCCPAALKNATTSGGIEVNLCDEGDTVCGS